MPSSAELLVGGSKIRLKSWKGDYLHRPDSNQGVTSWHTGVGNEWTVETIDGGKIQLKSWKGDYLHRPDSNQGVTSWHTGIGNSWTAEAIDGGKIQLKSWKGDYLHRPDSNQGVTSWHTGVGNGWTIEIISVPEAPSEVTPEPELIPEPEPIAEATGSVEITDLAYHGQVKRAQSDEYIQITNKGNSSVDLSGWQVTSAAGTTEQVFTFPEGTMIAAGQNLRVYTNEVHPETGGFSFGSSTAIWNDKGDQGQLLDAAGKVVSTWTYGSMLNA
jgi:hypothetical protein